MIHSETTERAAAAVPVSTRAARRRLARAAAATLAAGFTALTLVACAAIPGSGPVEVGLDDLRQAEQVVQFSAAGPIAGATQEQLVRGFLTAANSPVDNYAVAREYLTTKYSNQWDPYSGVMVGEGSRPYRSDGDAVGVLSLSIVATVSHSGVLQASESQTSTELRFDFEREGDEWRIASAPSGLILDRATFLAIWSAHQLFFLSADDRLVPDTRWFLSNTALATGIVSALIEGPSELLAPAVQTGFGPGVRLAKAGVPVGDGLARVDLTGDAMSDPVTQQRMLRQLQSSLQTVPGVNRVELLVDGTVVRGATESLPPTNTSMVGNRVAGISSDRFGLLTGDGVEPVSSISAAIEPLTPKAIALSRSKTVAAVLDNSGLSVIGDNYQALVDTRSGLLPPSVDEELWTWSAAATEPGVVKVISTSGVQRDLAVPWLDGSHLKALRVSPNGSLVAALVSQGEKSRVLVASVIRDATGAPIAIGPEPDAVLFATGDGIDLDWVDSLRVVTLTKQGTAGKVTVGGPGFFPSEQGSVPDATTVAGGGSRAGIRVLGGTDGELFAPQGSSGWQRVFSEVELLAKRG